MTPSDRRYLKLFGVVAALYAGLVLYANSRLVDLRETPFPFDQMATGQRVVTAGLTREQLGELKLSYALSAPQLDVALFGNHVSQYFGTESFQMAGRPDVRFFNYWYANLSAVDLLDLFTWLEARNIRLPPVAVVQLTTPNNDNGAYLVNRSKDLPADIAFSSEGADAAGGRTLLDRAEGAVTRLRSKLGAATSYATLLTGLATRGSNLSVIDSSQCTGGAQGFVDRLPFTIRLGLSAVGIKSGMCDPSLWSQALLRDGSYDSSGLNSVPRRDAAKLDPTRTALHPSDIEPLSEVLAKLDAIGKRHGSRVVLLIPPVYESERFSVVDEVFNAVLAKVPHVAVMDHRSWRNRPADHFLTYDHPSPIYWRGVVEEMEKSGLLPPVRTKDSQS